MTPMISASGAVCAQGEVERAGLGARPVAEMEEAEARRPGLAQCAWTGRHTAGSLVLLSITRTSKFG